MKLAFRAKVILALIVGGIVLTACHDHPESAGDRPADHHGAYGGVEGGGF